MKYDKANRDLFVVAVLTLVAVMLSFTIPSSMEFIRLLSLPLALVLPGYALTSALFPRKISGAFEYLLFSLGLSLIVVILGGLVLNLTPFGLRTGSWTLFLAAITLGACVAALMRRRSENILDSSSHGVRNMGLTFRQWILVSLSALLVCGTIVASIIGALQQAYPGFTQLWMLPTGGTSAKHSVQLGVSNRESTAMHYSLDVDMNGKTIQKWPSIYLHANEQWETTLVLPSIHTTSASRVEAMLYRADAPTKVYRNVILWVTT